MSNKCMSCLTIFEFSILYLIGVWYISFLKNKVISQLDNRTLAFQLCV